MYVIDIEASGLAEESYPIEIAWQSVSNEDDFDSFLIQPIDSWKHWDAYAEEHVHHISRNSLFEQGISAQSACERLNESLKNKVVYSDAVNFDERWMLKLFNDLGITLNGIWYGKGGQFDRGVQYALVNRYSSFGGEVEGRDDVPLFLGGPVCPEAATCLVCPQSRHPPGSELFGYKESLLAFAIDISRHTPPRVAMIEHFFNLHPLTNC